MPRFSKSLFLTALLAGCAAFLTVAPRHQDNTLQAQGAAFAMSEEEVDEIIKKYADVAAKAGNAKERIDAINALALTNSEKAYDKLMRLFKPDKFESVEEQRVLYALSTALGEFTDDALLEKTGKTALKLKKSEDMYVSYLMLKGVAKTDTPAARTIIKEALATESFLMAVGLQAIIETGSPFWAPELLKLIQSFRVMPTEAELKRDRKAEPHLDDKARKKFIEGLPLLAVSTFEALGKTYKHEYVDVPLKNGQPDESSEAFKKYRAAEDLTLSYLEELAIMIKLIEDDYVRYYAARSFQEIATLAGDPTDNDKWITFYLAERRLGNLQPNGLPKEASGETGPHRTRTKGPAFVGMPPVGKRIVICIDISASMEEEVTDKIIEKRKEQAKKRPPITGEGGAAGKEDEKEEEKEKDHRDRIPWSKIKTRMDLAKADFELTLEDMDESYYFNVVVYSKEANLIDDSITGFVKANKANKAHFLDLVKDAETVSLTNIHGAILDAFRVTTKGGIKEGEDEATTPEALIHGANTIFFLTDGWGSWSDDSVEKVPDERITRDREPRIGDGKYIYYKDIKVDFERINKFRKVIVNCVGIGDHDTDLMSWLAYKSGGQYIDLSGKNRKPPKHSD